MTTPAGHANRVFEKSTSTGTGNLLLNGAENGFYSFFAGFGTGVTLGYVAENPITGENEVGIGEVIDNGGGSYSLQRNSVETSSNGNALVNFAAGFKYCRATFLASEGAIIGAGSTGTGAIVLQTSPTINTPTIVGSGGTLTLPAGPDTLVGRATTDTLTNKTLVAPALGAATATSINKVALTAPATGATMTIADGSTLATSGAFSTTLTATGATNVTLPTTGTLATLAGTETLTNKTLTSPIIGTISNTGTLTLPTTTDTLVGLATVDTLTNKTLTNPTLTTPILGAATATSINKVTITAPATGSTLTIADGATLATSGAFSVTLTSTAGTNVTLPTTGTLATLAGVETLTNKSIVATQLTGTIAAARMPALTGDITTSAGAVATTLAANVVTYAKFQKMSTVTLLGNATGGTANAAEITLGTSLTFSGSTLNTIQGLRTTDSPTFAGASFTSATIAGPTITGGSASGQGAYFLWQRTGAVNPFYIGHHSAIMGGTSGNALFYSAGDSLEFAPSATVTLTLTTTSATFASSVLSTSATAVSGYATGAGGSVTQATSRTTGVTLSKPCGTITTNSTSLAAGATAKFTVTNTLVAAADHIDLTIQSGTTTDATRARVQSTAAGSFTIVIENGHASTAETGAILLNFAIRKSVTA